MRESDTYTARATAAAADADAATLDNVRERCLRAEQAWSKMAERSLRVETARASREGATQASVALAALSAT